MPWKAGCLGTASSRIPRPNNCAPGTNQMTAGQTAIFFNLRIASLFVATPQVSGVPDGTLLLYRQK